MVWSISWIPNTFSLTNHKNSAILQGFFVVVFLLLLFSNTTLWDTDTQRKILWLLWIFSLARKAQSVKKTKITSSCHYPSAEEPYVQHWLRLLYFIDRFGTLWGYSWNPVMMDLVSKPYWSFTEGFSSLPHHLPTNGSHFIVSGWTST